jgi:PDZ domain-containing protein
VAVKLAAGSYTAREREKRARLSRQPLLAGCSPLTLRRIAAVADEITARPGDVLVHQGRHVFWFFLIQQGRADVVRDGATVARLKSGEYFGEVVLERGGVQPATVVATTPMRLFVIGSQRFVPLAHDVRRLRRRLHVAPERGRRSVHQLRFVRPARTPAPLPRRPVVVPPPRRRRRVPLGLGVAAAVLAVGGLYHPPLAVVAPGPSFDVARDIAITGIDASAPRGEYLLTTVTSSRPTLIGVLATTFRVNRQIVPAGRVTPPATERQHARRRQAALFRDSRVIGAAAAARAAGLPMSVSGTGASVLDAGFGLPATRSLQNGDVIVAVLDPQPQAVHSAVDLVDLIRAQPAGTTFRLDVERGGRDRHATVEVVSAEDEGHAGLVGVSLGTRDLRVQLPFEIRFRNRRVVGPSAGLAYALAVADMLSPEDLARGRRIAVTGEIGPDGAVQPVAYLQEKAAAAHRAGARVFVVPGAQAYAAAGHGMTVDGVSSLDEAIKALRAG